MKGIAEIKELRKSKEIIRKGRRERIRCRRKGKEAGKWRKFEIRKEI